MSTAISDEVVTEISPVDVVETTDLGQEVEGDVVEATPEQEVDLLSADEYGDRYVSVVVDGKEVKVPLKEALSGYQRQADYTRKTQELSEQRRQVQFGSALQEALQNNPAGTLELLSQHYGTQQQPSEEDELFADPVAKQYRQLEQRVQVFEQQKAMDELNKTVQTLQARYGEDFNADEVLSKAIATGTTDLEAVFKQSAFDRIFENRMETNKVEQQKLDETRRITESKRQASIVSGGSTASSADVSAAPITSLKDAWDAAKRELGE